MTDTYWDQSYYPGMGTGERVPPTITSPADGDTVAPVHDVTGTASPGQTVTLWSAIGDDALHVHSTVVADEDGNWASTGAQVTGRDGDVATFVARTLGGSSDPVLVTVAGPVLASISPDTAEATVADTYTLTGQRLDSTPLQVRITDTDGSARRVEASSVSATSVTFDATFAAEGTAEVSLAATGDGTTAGPEMTARLDVAVSAAPAPPEASTGATAGTPGVFTPDGSTPPQGASDGMLTLTADPATAWTTGQYVASGDGTYWYWDGEAWAEGEAP